MDFQVVMAILFEIPVFFGPPCRYLLNKSIELVSPVVDTLRTVAVVSGVAAVSPLAAAVSPVPGRVTGGGAAVL